MIQRRVLRLYTPHDKQMLMHLSKTRFMVGSWGRQSGKSTCALNQLVHRAWNNPHTRYWFVSPTFPQARVMYRRLVGMLWACKDVLVKKNQTELRIKLLNGSEIRFVSGEVLDNLRGDTLHGCVIDEVRDQHPDLWPMVIRPMLATTRGWCWFISTPNGFDHFYDLAQLANKDPEWSFVSAPSTANPLFTQEEFEAARRNMSEAQFAQEILAEFRDLTSGKAYLSFGQHNFSETCPFMPDLQWSPYHSIVLGMDFNLSPMSWTLGQLAAEKWWWFDEIYLENSHTMEAAKELRDKILFMKSLGFRGTPDVVLCGDATGKATQRSSNQSDYDIVKSVLKEVNISFRDETPESNPSIKDRVNAVNYKCKDAKGETSMWVNKEKCPMLAKDLERVVWKPGADYTLDPGPKKMLTHPSDSIGYPVMALTPPKLVREIGRVKVIQRVF